MDKQDIHHLAIEMTYKRAYRPLPPRARIVKHDVYESNLPSILKLAILGEREKLRFYTPRGTLIATHTRDNSPNQEVGKVVIGDYGAYIEFTPEQMELDNIKSKWAGEPRRPVKYIWHIPKDGSEVKIYEQRGTVEYADYKVGMYYIAPNELYIA